MITKRWLDLTQVKAQTKIQRIVEDWKMKFDSGAWKEVDTFVQEGENAQQYNSQEG